MTDSPSTPFEVDDDADLPPGSPYAPEDLDGLADSGEVVDGYTRWTTIGELLQPDGTLLLPGGLFHEGKRIRRVSLREWRGRDDVWLGELKKIPGVTPFLFLKGFLGRFLDELGDEAFEFVDAPARKMKKDRARREDRIARLLYGDAIFLLFALRALEVSEDLRWTGLRCGHCGHGFDYETDLFSVPVREIVPEIASPEALAYDVPTGGRRPWKVAGAPVASLRMRPARFSFLASIKPEERNEAVLEERMRRDGLVEGCKASDLEDAPKRVLVALDKELGKRSPGPVIAVRDKCPRCATPWGRVIDYSYEVFFRAGRN